MSTTINSRSQLRPAVHSADHLMGTGLAPVMLVLFGDYECHHSRKVDAVIRQQVLRALPGEVDYVFRHFPLVRIHPRAQTAALAAEAAAAQDAFWPMHDLLFLNQRHLRFPDLESYAAHLDLDLARFRADVIDGRYLLRIRADLRSGVGAGCRPCPQCSSTATGSIRRWTRTGSSMTYAARYGRSPTDRPPPSRSEPRHPCWSRRASSAS